MIAQAAILVIPGVGGHPAFHGALIAALREAGPVHTSPHGDFNAAPFGSMDLHIDFWQSVAEGIGAKRVVLVGISFGAQVALGLARRMGDRIAGCVLISWWPIGIGERICLGALHRLSSSALSLAVGKVLFRWSEHTSDDASQLKRIRLALYDDERAVHARLLSRLLCCRGVRNRAAAGLSGGIHFIWGSAELAHIRAFAVRAQLRQAGEIHLLKGTHAMSTSRSPRLEALTATLTRQMCTEVEKDWT